MKKTPPMRGGATRPPDPPSPGGFPGLFRWPLTFTVAAVRVKLHRIRPGEPLGSRPQRRAWPTWLRCPWGRRRGRGPVGTPRTPIMARSRTRPASDNNALDNDKVDAVLNAINALNWVELNVFAFTIAELAAK